MFFCLVHASFQLGTIAHIYICISLSNWGDGHAHALLKHIRSLKRYVQHCNTVSNHVQMFTFYFFSITVSIFSCYCVLHIKAYHCGECLYTEIGSVIFNRPNTKITGNYATKTTILAVIARLSNFLYQTH